MDLDEHYSELLIGAFSQFAERLDPDDLGKLEERLESVAQDLVPRFIDIAAEALVEGLHARAAEMITEYRGLRHGFEDRLERRWGAAFGLSQMVMVSARETGEAFHQKHVAAASNDNDLVFFALIGLHARACRMSEEVMALMRAGFGQAAMTRWRALHEVAVVASFIKEHGKETARRYFAHEGVESWRAMCQYQRYAANLGAEPFSAGQVEEARRLRDELRQEFGRSFLGGYGWAVHALEASDPAFAEKKAVQFKDIEEAAGLDHLRPYYKLASHGVHANPKGITFNPDLLGERILLAGASNAGFVEPGHTTLISLVQVTASLLMSKPGEAAPVILTALLRLVDEAGQAYIEAHDRLAADEHPQG